MGLFKRSLRNKLIGAFLLPTLMIVLIYGMVAYNVARTELEAELGKRLTNVGQTLSSQLSGGLTAKQLARLDASKGRVMTRLRTRLLDVKSATGVRRVFLFDRADQSLVDTNEEMIFGQRIYSVESDRREVKLAWSKGVSTTSILFQDKQGTRYKTAYVPVFMDSDRKQVVAMIGVEASASYFALLRNFGRGLSLMGALGVLLVIIVGVLFARRLILPVNHLVSAAQRLGQGDLDTPVLETQAGPGDELQFLGQTFEEMRQNILSRDRQLQMMLSGIAHEVRNPLGGMELFCGLLKEDLLLDPQHEETLAKIEKVERIEKELNYLAKVVNDFLDFTRSKPLELERFNAKDFAAEIQNLLLGEIMTCDCELVIDVDESLELTAEREHLRRAIINTVRNAYQACDAGGRVTLQIHEADSTRVIEVIDQGCGMSDAQLEDVMTPFYTTKEKGSGLGLALIKKIIDQHAGQMTLKSVQGQGTTVQFVLPFYDKIKAPSMDIPEGWLG